LKILLTSHYLPPRHRAGTEIYTAALGEALTGLGHGVVILCREDIPHTEHFSITRSKKSGALHHTLNIPATRRGAFSSYRRFRDVFRNPVVSKNIGRIIDELSPDIIHVQHLLGLSTRIVTAAHERRIPVFFTLNDYWYLCHRIRLAPEDGAVCEGPTHGFRCARCASDGKTAHSPVAGALHLLSSFVRLPLTLNRDRHMKGILNLAELLIAPSNYIAQKYIQWGIPSGKVVVSDYGLQLNAHHRHSNRIRPEDSDHGSSSIHAAIFTFGYIGTISRHKGVHLLVEAFQHLRDSHPRRMQLLIFGDPGVDPPYSYFLEERICSADVHFRGDFDNNEIDAILSQVDLLVVPSLWAENSPLVIHEAFRNGVPVLASDIGGMQDLIPEGKGGKRFPPGDAVALEEEMKRFVSDETYYFKLQKTIPPVKSIEENARELETLYRNALSTTGAER
jgi:glycosyltransferase involved in cell wall biosynthesis